MVPELLRPDVFGTLKNLADEDAARIVNSLTGFCRSLVRRFLLDRFRNPDRRLLLVAIHAHNVHDDHHHDQ